VTTNPRRGEKDTAAQMANRRGRGSEAAHKASVPVGATALAVVAVLVAGVARAAREAPEADRAEVAVAALAVGVKSADSASTRSGKSITKIPRVCAATSPSEGRSSRAAS
jgi:hypothetical protein